MCIYFLDYERISFTLMCDCFIFIFPSVNHFFNRYPNQKLTRNFLCNFLVVALKRSFIYFSYSFQNNWGITEYLCNNGYFYLYLWFIFFHCNSVKMILDIWYFHWMLVLALYKYGTIIKTFYNFLNMFRPVKYLRFFSFYLV